jgi:hypothetical protein
VTVLVITLIGACMLNTWHLVAILTKSGKKMKIWVDDIRTPPDETWTWFKNSKECIVFLRYAKGAWGIDEMSLDHDLGGDDTSRAIVLWMCENEFWPNEVRVHSANPVGIEWLEGMIERYKPKTCLGCITDSAPHICGYDDSNNPFERHKS